MCIDSDRLRMYIHGTRASISNMSGVGIIGLVKGAKWRGVPNRAPSHSCTR